MRAFDNLAGQTFGIWYVLEFDHIKYYKPNPGSGAISFYRCECKKCGRIKLVARPNLLQGKCIRHHGRCV